MSNIDAWKCLTPIQEFYTGTNVFLTGATGFFGKIIIDKLFRFAPGVEGLYILIRAKKGKTVEQRLEDLFSDPVFNLLKQEFPEFRKKIHPIIGDCLEPELGINQDALDTIISKVNIVFHVAATVKFDEHIKTAVKINVRGTKALLDICKKCIDLKCLVYVSTAYSHCYNHTIEEKFHDLPLNPDKLMQFVEGQNEVVLQELTPKIIGRYPNTYAFSKAVAEQVVRENSEGLPVVLFRPAIVVGTYKEPIPGWIDNIYGPTGVVAGVGVGLIRVMCADENIKADIVPVDLVVNSMLATAWDVTNERKINEQPPVTNYVSSKRNPITWGQFFYWNMTFGHIFPLLNTVWFYTLRITPKKYWYYFLSIFQHFLPGLTIDLFRIMSGKKPKIVKAYRKINKFLDVISYFSTQEWDFQNDRVETIWNRMDDRDKKLLPYRMEDMKWDEFFFHNIKALRWCIMNDKEDTVVAARKRLAKLKFLHYSLKYLFIFFVFYMLYNVIFVKYFNFEFRYNCN